MQFQASILFQWPPSEPMLNRIISNIEFVVAVASAYREYSAVKVMQKLSKWSRQQSGL